MSKFFKALEQAERERAIREQARQAEPKGAEVESRPPATAPETEAPIPRRETATPASVAPQPGPPAPKPAHRRRLEPLPEIFEDAPEGVDEHLVSLLNPTTFEAEQYRALRHLIEQMHKSADLSVVAVSSPCVSDGKTTTALNLAGALAQAPEARVLLVDCDLRNPSAADQIGLGDERRPGLVDVILDPGLTLEDVVRRRPPFNLVILPAGRSASAPYEVLKSPRLGEILEEARRRYDYIVLDTPPVVPVPDCRVIERCIDGFLLVVAAHKTPRRLVAEALSVVDPAKLVGLVFNVDDRQTSTRYYAYGYASDRSRNGNRRTWWGLWRARRSGRGRRHS